MAGRLEAGLALAEKADADFAVIDLNLDGQRTYGIAETLKRRGIPFMFGTGYGSGGVDAAWREQVVMQKPFAMAEFESAMAQALA